MDINQEAVKDSTKHQITYKKAVSEIIRDQKKRCYQAFTEIVTKKNKEIIVKDAKEQIEKFEKHAKDHLEFMMHEK